MRNHIRHRLRLRAERLSWLETIPDVAGDIEKVTLALKIAVQRNRPSKRKEIRIEMKKRF